MLLFWPGKPLARRRPKKAEECVWRPPPCPNVERRYSTFQTKQVVFTRRDAAQPTSKNSEGCAKRERRHAPHASHRAQARRTRPSSSLPAPKQCSGNAPRAQVNVNSTGARGGRLDEESCDALAPAHLEWVQFSLQGACNRIYQARAQERRALSCFVKMYFHQRQAVLLAAQCCRADRLLDTQLCLPVRVYGLLYVVRVVSGRVIECCSANCA